METSTSKTIKKSKPCKTMILDVVKIYGTYSSMTAASIISEIEKKYPNYNMTTKKVFIKNALKKLIGDKTLLESNGKLKLNPQRPKKHNNNPPGPNKRALSAKKITVAAKRALKKINNETSTSKSKSSGQKTDGKPKIKLTIEEYNEKIFMSDQLYQDLCTIGAGKFIIGRACKNGRNTYAGKNKAGNCFLAALSLGFMKIDPKNGAEEMNKVMHEEECPNCGKETLKATVKDLLRQVDRGWDYATGGTNQSDRLYLYRTYTAQHITALFWLKFSNTAT